jgi:hypothetical protein
MRAGMAGSRVMQEKRHMALPTREDVVAIREGLMTL